MRARTAGRLDVGKQVAEMSETETREVAIIGVGAMGSLFAGRLSPIATVIMVGHWPQQLAALNARGVTVIDSDGRRSTHSVTATADIATMRPVNLALILVKSYQTEKAAQMARIILTKEGLALTLQNGLGNWETLTAALGPHRVALGVTSQGATLVVPGSVRDAGTGPIHLAATPETAVRVNAAADLLRRAGFETHVSRNVASLIWGKLAVNAAINPLTALLGVPNGYLIEHAWTRALMLQAAEEVAAVAAGRQISLPYPSASERALAVAQATAANQSSMLQDLKRGAPTEIKAICGAVVRAGREVGVATPINEQLLHLIRARQDGRLEADWQTTLKERLN